MQGHIGCICLTFLHFAFLNVPSNCLHLKRRGIVTLVTFVWLFSTVRYKMSFQMVCFRRCKVTLVAFVWPFSAVLFEMCLQNVSPRRGKVTLVAFVWLFSTLIFQMCPQIVCTRNCIITLFVLRRKSSMSALVRPGLALSCASTSCVH